MVKGKNIGKESKFKTVLKSYFVEFCFYEVNKYTNRPNEQFFFNMVQVSIKHWYNFILHFH